MSEAAREDAVVSEAVRAVAVPLHVRVGVDVYSAYQDQYLGTVIAVWRRSAPTTGAGLRETAATEASRGPRSGGAAGSKVLGESLGPAPSTDVGNTGPRAQSAANLYATRPGPEPADVIAFAVRPGRMNPFARPLYVPTSAVRSISMERIILDVERDAIPAAWREAWRFGLIL